MCCVRYLIILSFLYLARHSMLCAEELAGIPVSVLTRTVVEVPNGTVTYLRIRPPNLPPRPAPPQPAPDVPLSPKQQAALERYEAKTFAFLAVTATVYTRSDDSVAVTELTWRDEARSYRAWSNADFRLLSQINEIETATHRFQWFPFISTQALAGLTVSEQPVGLALFGQADLESVSEYYLEDGIEAATAAEASLDALDLLHARHHLHRDELAAELTQRETEAAERAEKAAAQAARPKNEKVYFWKIQ